MKFIELRSLKEFQNTIKKKTISIIYFYSDDFHTITNKINRFLDNNYDTSIIYYKINIIKYPEISKNEDITTFPILRIYRENEFIKEIFCTYSDIDNILKTFQI